MAKFKVGEKVLIKKNVTSDETCIPSKTLKKFRNEPMTIETVYDDSYDVKENYYIYEEDWLEPYAETVSYETNDLFQNDGKDREANKFEAFLREVADGNKYSHGSMYLVYSSLYDLVNHYNSDDKYYLSDEEFESIISHIVDFYVNEFVPEEDKPAIEMTLSEVEKALGHKVKIKVDEKEKEQPWEWE